MARIAVTKKFYNNLGEVVEATMADFRVKHNVSRRALYNERGAWDEVNEVYWRVDKAPVINKQIATSSQKYIYDILVAEGHTAATASYDANLEFVGTQPETKKATPEEAAAMQKLVVKAMAYQKEHKCGWREAKTAVS